jgi:predicted RNase H-like nuclease (RuvC/YqgF family)
MSIKILKQIKSVTFSLLAISSFSFANENCEALKGCAEKSCQVEKQIALAKKNGNSHKIDGLNKALAEITEHCSDDKIISDIEDDLSKAYDELKEHQEELKEAQAEEKSDKIEKYNAKIKEDEAEISALKAELSKMNSEIK